MSSRPSAYGRARRRERAAERLTAALLDKGHEWKSNDGREKAQACLATLNGSTASTIVDGPEIEGRRQHPTPPAVGEASRGEIPAAAPS